MFQSMLKITYPLVAFTQRAPDNRMECNHLCISSLLAASMTYSRLLAAYDEKYERFKILLLYILYSQNVGLTLRTKVFSLSGISNAVVSLASVIRKQNTPHFGWLAFGGEKNSSMYPPTVFTKQRRQRSHLGVPSKLSLVR